MDKFTIILTNYNQEQYIFEALKSIANQTYKNIELIVADDCSNVFEKDKISKYVKKNSNIDLKFVINDTNLGTVKTMNKCLKSVTGKYVLIFAADDVLHDNKVIESFYNAFKLHKTYSVISSICLLYDEKMENINGEFPDNKIIESFNNMNALIQNKSLKFGPVFAPGATAYRYSLLKKVGFIDEKYKLIEDWSTFLKITRLNNKIYIENFISINHRGGGVSETKKIRKDICDNVLKDTHLIYKNEVFNSLNNFSVEEKLQVLYRYQIFKNYYGYKYYPIYLKYYYEQLKNTDVLLYKFRRKGKIFNFIIFPILSVIISLLIARLSNCILTMIILPLIIYYILKRLLYRGVK